MPISDIAAKAAKETVGEIMGGLDNLITSKEEKLAIKQQMMETIQDGMNTAMDRQSEVIMAEAKGTWLQKSWRPIMALAFGFIVVATYFIFPIINLWLKSEDLHNLIMELKSNEGFWKLLTLMISGYTIARSAEKMFASDDRDATREKVKGIFKRKNKKDE